MTKKSSKVSIASVASILGIAPVQELTTCVVCLKEIPAARIKALKLMNASKDRWTHTACSTTSKIKGIYLGENGTSQLQLCEKVYNDSIRSVFRRADTVSDEEEVEEEK